MAHTRREEYRRENFLFGIEDDVERAVSRVLTAWRFSTHLGLGRLWVAFSGGKDSVAVYGVCRKAAERAGVPLKEFAEFHYNVTNLDPPELVRFIRREFPDVVMDKPATTFWDLVVKNKMLPTRLMRFCCAELKEKGGTGRFCVTGVRRAESARRSTRGEFEDVGRNKKEGRILNADNDDDRREMEHCIPKRKYMCNPIVDWSEDTVWRFIVEEDLPYCCLYDEGFNRLGCIGCPMAPKAERRRQLERWPAYRRQYLRTIERMLEARRNAGLRCDWKDAEECLEWWLNG